MIAQRNEGQGGKVLTVDLVQTPGEVAFRVTIQPSPVGNAWSTDARPVLPVPSAPEPVQPLAREAPDAAGPNTHALDELFSRGL
jgi:hypothetical protein